MADLYKLTPEQLEALAAKKRREREPDVVHQQDQQTGQSSLEWPTTCSVHGATFRLVPELSDDWEFQRMLTAFGKATQDGDSEKSNRLADELVSYMYVEPYEDIVAILKDLHPEDERPHVHAEDIAALIQGGIPKV